MRTVHIQFLLRVFVSIYLLQKFIKFWVNSYRFTGKEKTDKTQVPYFYDLLLRKTVSSTHYGLNYPVDFISHLNL